MSLRGQGLKPLNCSSKDLDRCDQISMYAVCICNMQLQHYGIYEHMLTLNKDLFLVVILFIHKNDHEKTIIPCVCTLPLSPLSANMISAGSAWRSGKSTARRQAVTIAAPATRSSSRWRSSPRRWLKRYRTAATRETGRKRPSVRQIRVALRPPPAPKQPASGSATCDSVSCCGFSGREEAQELPGTGSLHALLHTLQEPRAQLSGKRVRLARQNSSRLRVTGIDGKFAAGTCHHM